MEKEEHCRPEDPTKGAGKMLRLTFLSRLSDYHMYLCMYPKQFKQALSPQTPCPRAPSMPLTEAAAMPCHAIPSILLH